MAVITDVNAQSAVRLTSGSSSSECTYSTMSVLPNGTVSVVCSSAITPGGTNPPPTNPGNPSFSLSTGGGTLAAGATASIGVVRGGASAGAYTVPYTVSGDACTTTGTFSVSFGDGDAAQKPITQVVIAQSGSSCVVTLQSSFNSGTTVATFTREASTNPNPNPVPGGCPATPAGMQTATWRDPYLHNLWVYPMNTVVSVPMPTNVPSSVPSFSWAPSAMVNSPSSGFVRFSISKCPGQIVENDPGNWCNGRYAATTFTQRYVAVVGGLYRSKDIANLYGVCWAPNSEGQWYLNFRYESFSSCAGGSANCGLLWQRQ